ncbi:MAG: DegT/DnrJ/EryC1/StrS family aminotransferase [Candidatus Coatesbacteria bacterium]|nr:MAG: DegT/DnrJ/EryC1/StrS family aminotransferase [Candidatus Coatesbacteria bacterium]
MSAKPAIEGGRPELSEYVPYSRPSLRKEDIEAAVGVLRSQWLTTGPKIRELEEIFAKLVGAREAAAVNSGTAALHLAYDALGLNPGDEVLVPSLTFSATASSVIMAGGTPVAVDVEGESLNISLDDAARYATNRTRAISPVHIGGLPCDMDGILDFTSDNIAVVQDACHAIGAEYKGRPLGGFGFAAAYSFHAVKQVAAGEGGALALNDEEAAEKVRRTRHHGLSTSPGERHGAGASYYYEITGLGYNYRLSDVQAALVISQLERADKDLVKREELATEYDSLLEPLVERELLETIPTPPEVRHARHLYIIKLNLGKLSVGRDRVFAALRAENVGVNVHYIPLYRHPFYRDRFGWDAADFPVTESVFERILSLPMFTELETETVGAVVRAVGKVLTYYKR